MDHPSAHETSTPVQPVTPPPGAASAGSASLLQTFRAVLWSFFGIRRGRDHAADMARLNPLHVIAMGLLAALLFILTLVGVVRWVLA